MFDTLFSVLIDSITFTCNVVEVTLLFEEDELTENPLQSESLTENVQEKTEQDAKSPEKREAEESEKQDEFVRTTEAKKQEFEKHFRYGSTTVYFYDGKFYFWGDIGHCGEEAIFHNAREIKKRMGSFRYGHMNYNDMPTFTNPKDPKAHWEREQQQRENIYRDDLYCFEGDEIILVKKIPA